MSAADICKELPQHVKDSIAKNTCPIKPEFLVHPAKQDNWVEAVPEAEAVAKLAEAKDAGSESTAEVGEKRTLEDTPQNPVSKRSKSSKKKDKKRGMNKNIQAFHSKRNPVQLCTNSILGKKCDFGKHCKWSHDTLAYLSHKPADLDGRCYIYDVRGDCRYGVSCRYANAHTDAEGNQLHQDLENPAAAKAENELPRKVMDDIRRGRYQYSSSVPVVQAFRKYRKMRQLPDDEKTVVELDQAGVFDYIVESEEPGTDSTKGHRTLGQAPIRGKPSIDFSGKLILAPLTTVGNLPFRRICKRLGADVTVGEMAVAQKLLQGQQQEWALLKRHQSEDCFGVQIAVSDVEQGAKVCELINNHCRVDFVDLNVGCPIDAVTTKGMGSALMQKASQRLYPILRGMTTVLEVPTTLKIRTGWSEASINAKEMIPKIENCGVQAVAIHGRTRRQRYSKLADWDYVRSCADGANIPIIGNGDVYTFEDYEASMANSKLSACMIARGALVKPWIFTEIKERRHWDISSAERFQLLKDFVDWGLENWGSDDWGVDNTRNFLLQWLSFTCRYVPVGLLDQVQATRLNWKAPKFVGRDDMETLLASRYCGDWIKISEMLLGPVPEGFVFTPKHKASAHKDE